MTGVPTGALPAREAYRLWAPLYGDETVVSALDERAARRLTPPLAGRALLDVGCGTGRRLLGCGAGEALGVDLSPDMLAAGRRRKPGLPPVLAADVRALPLTAGRFDVLWCRLVLGHLVELAVAYRELARVCRPGGGLLVTDFHPAAAAAGHRRTFRDAAGGLHEVEHHVHRPEDHARAAAAAGWRLATSQEEVVGPEARPFYESAGRTDAYQAQRGLPLVLALWLTR